MPFKFSMLFNFGGSGFSESWYYTGGAPAATGPLLVGDFKALSDSRARMCGADVFLAGARLSDVDNPRQTVAQVNIAASVGTALPDTVSNAWLAIARGAGRVGRRQLWLRGLPDDEILFNETTQQFIPQGGLSKAIAQYENLLKAGPWAIRTVQSKKAAAAANQAIGAIAPSTGGGGATLTGPAGVDPATAIVVGGFKKPLGFMNGTYEPLTGFMVGADGKVTLLNRALSTFQALGYPGGASLRPQVFAYTPVGSLNLEFPRSRRVGRAFFTARGRRPAR